MKKFAPLLTIFAIVILIVALFLSLGKVQNMTVIKEGNLKKIPLEMQVNKFQDSDCGMVITDFEYASQVIAPDGKTWFFHDHGGFVHWLKDKAFEKSAVIWVRAKDTDEWIDGRKAFYSRNDITPMGYGFGAYKVKREGMLSFEEMRLKMLRGETMNNPKIKKQLLGK